QQRRVDAGVAQGDGLLHLRDRQPVGAGLEGGPPDGGGAVAVAVGLDHRAQPGGAGDPAQGPHVVADGLEVDLGPGPRHQRPTSPSSPRAAGRPSTTSEATRPRAGPRAAARPCSQAPAAAASKASMLWHSRAPTMPEITSPVPAVARRASPLVERRTRPSGWSTTVVGPFSSTTAPVSAARRRAAAMRSGPGGAPVSRANSPSWGVSTGGAVRRATTAATWSPSRVSPSPSTSSGTCTDEVMWWTAASLGALRPSPGPSTTAPARAA